MTGGIVGGLARLYLPFTWGIPFVVFGYDLAANIQAYVDILTLCSTTEITHDPLLFRVAQGIV